MNSIFVFTKDLHRYVFVVERGRELSGISGLLEMGVQAGLNINFKD